jgi:hypothetical protein
MVKQETMRKETFVTCLAAGVSEGETACRESSLRPSEYTATFDQLVVTVTMDYLTCLYQQYKLIIHTHHELVVAYFRFNHDIHLEG